MRSTLDLVSRVLLCVSATGGILAGAQAPARPQACSRSGSRDVQLNLLNLTDPCYTLFNRRIRSEVLACSGYRLLANFHIAFAVNQYRRSNTQWNREQ